MRVAAVGARAALCSIARPSVLLAARQHGWAAFRQPAVAPAAISPLTAAAAVAPRPLGSCVRWAGGLSWLPAPPAPPQPPAATPAASNVRPSQPLAVARLAPLGRPPGGTAASLPAGAPRRGLHGTPSAGQDFRPHRPSGGFGGGGGGGGGRPFVSWPLALALGGVVVMVFGGALLVLLVPIVLFGGGALVLLLLLRGGGASRGAGALQSLLGRLGGAAPAGGAGAAPSPLLGRWALSLLARATSALAARAEAQARVGRYVHHNLQARVRASPTIRELCGRGVVLGPPVAMHTLTASVGVGVPPAGASATSTRVRCEAPIVHDRLGARAMLVVDAVVTPAPPPAPSGGSGGGDIADAAQSAWGRFKAYAEGVVASVTGGERRAGGGGEGEDPREAAYREVRARRMRERVERRARRARAGAGGDPGHHRGSSGHNPLGMDVGEVHEFIREMMEDVADEAAHRGDGRPPMTVVVERAELRLPGGRAVSMDDELGGLFVEDVFTAATGAGGGGGEEPPEGARRGARAGGGDRGRVVEAEWRESHR